MGIATLIIGDPENCVSRKQRADRREVDADGILGMPRSMKEYRILVADGQVHSIAGGLVLSPEGKIRIGFWSELPFDSR